MRFTIGMAFIFISLLFSVGLNFLYFSKKHVRNYETRLFSIFLPSNLIGLLLELSCSLSISFFGIDSFISVLLARLFLVYLLFFGLLLILYVYVVCGSEETVIELTEKQKDIRNIFIAVIIFSSIITLVLPIELNSSNGAMYSTGLATLFVYTVSGLASLYCVLKFALNWKILKKRKSIPLVVYIVGTGIMTLIQQRFPEFTIATSMEAFVIFLMYNTIENPDLKMVQALELAKEEADKANRSKTEFLSSMSHEIRTPLNAIVGFSDCILDANTVVEAKENAKDIVDASQTLLEIVNGILDISKIEAGKLEITNIKYNSIETFNELAKLITPRMKDKGLDFTYEIDSNIPPTLFGDQANIKKIVTNFLSNAVKYTDYGFVRYEVHSKVMGDYARIVISVEDSGRGIKQENVEKMFTRFQRLDEDKNSAIEGTGLGLAITKQLTELMGGKVIVRTKYGSGSKFTVVFNQKIEDVAVSEKPKMKETLDLRDVKILLVDDAPLNLKVATKLFEKYNANNIETCVSGFECIDKIRSGKTYDIIFLDDMMPKMNGIDTFHQLKQYPGFHTPIVALTANAISGMKENYLAEGFNDYLAKPMDQRELVRVCNSLLGRSDDSEFAVIDSTDDDDENREDKNRVIPVESNIEEILGDLIELRKTDSEPTTIISTPETVPTTNPIDDGEIEDLSDESSSTEVEALTIEDEPSSDEIESLTLEDEPSPTEVESLTIEDEPAEVESLTIEETPELSSSEVYDRAYLEKNGADVEHGLELLGDMEMYNMTLHDFLEEVDDKWKRINDALADGNMENYAIDVHSLKSDCKYLGFMGLADIAYDHELKSKAKELDYCREHFPELEKEYNRVIEVIRNYASNNPVEE